MCSTPVSQTSASSATSTGMQLVGWQTRFHTLEIPVAKYRFCNSCSSGKAALVLCYRFPDCYFHWNSNMMCHVTKHCSVIGLHNTVWQDTARSGCGLWDCSKSGGHVYEAASIHILSILRIGQCKASPHCLWKGWSDQSCLPVCWHRKHQLSRSKLFYYYENLPSLYFLLDTFYKH